MQRRTAYVGSRRRRPPHLTSASSTRSNPATGVDPLHLTDLPEARRSGRPPSTQLRPGNDAEQHPGGLTTGVLFFRDDIAATWSVS